MSVTSESKCRQILKDMDAKLYGVLGRNWEIAQEQWLPALGVSKGSFNSYPHLRNLENYLDAVLIEESDRLRVDLGALELYLALAAILFHDIGRILEEGTKGNSVTEDTERAKSIEGSKTKHEHAYYSKETLQEKYGFLGVPSREIAHVLGEICYYHGPDYDDLEDIDSKLRDTVIDPYGYVRPSIIGALLVLVDNLDASTTRVLPQYVQGPYGPEEIGRFRSMIPGIRIDIPARMICTVIDDEVLKDPKDPSPQSQILYRASEWTLRHRNEKMKGFAEVVEREYKGMSPEKNGIKKPGLSGDRIGQLFRESNLSNQKIDGLMNEHAALLDAARMQPFAEADRLVAGGVLRAFREESRLSWPKHTTLAIAMSSVADSNRALKRIQKRLASARLFFSRWLVEYKEHLYSRVGEETWEPVFSRDYLVRVSQFRLPWNTVLQVPL